MARQGVPSGTRSCDHMELPPPTPSRQTNPQVPWTQLPHLDFPKQTNTARTTQPDLSQRIDTVFFKRHVDDWNV